MISFRRKILPACLALLGSAWFGFVAIDTWVANARTAEDRVDDTILPQTILDQANAVGLELSVREVQSPELESSLWPYDATRTDRLEVTYHLPAAGGAALEPSLALGQLLGPSCFARALGPLVSAEADGGDLPYVVGIVLDAVMAAKEAGRLTGSVPGPLALLALCLSGILLALLALRRPFTSVPQKTFYAPDFMVRDLSTAEAEQERLDDAIVAIRSELSAKEAAFTSPMPTPSGLAWLDFIQNARDTLGRTKHKLDTRAVRGQIVELEMTLDRARKRQAKIVRAVAAQARSENRRHRRRVRWVAFANTTPAIGAMLIFLLATVHAALAIGLPELLMPPTPTGRILIRGDTLIATALAAHPEFRSALANHCMIRVVVPEPSDVRPSTLLDLVAGETTVLAKNKPASVTLAAMGGRQCKIGSPCGGACIPAGRICRVGSLEPGHGKACGDGYIAMAKTCRIEPPEPARADQTKFQNTRALPEPSYQSEPRSSHVVEDRLPYSSPTSGSSSSGSGTTATPTQSGTVHVQGYTRQDGKVVQSYERSAPSRGHR